jgi:hypothetical protein
MAGQVLDGTSGFTNMKTILEFGIIISVVISWGINKL